MNEIIRDKSVAYKILIYLSKNTDLKHNNYAERIKKETDCTSSRLVTVLRELKTVGLLTIEKSGRINHLKITKKGKRLAILLDRCRKLIYD